MRDDTKSKLIILAVIAIMVVLGIILLIGNCYEIKAEQAEILINQYPFWAEDSTFQTVQILKRWEIFPDGQRELLGYLVAVDSSGVRIYEEKPEYFLTQATFRALSLRRGLAKLGR